MVLLLCGLLAGLAGCGTDVETLTTQVEQMVTGDHPLEAATVSQEKYAYNTLDDHTKAVYDEIVYAIRNREERVQIATTDIDEMELAYLAVRYDYCDLFWLEQFSYVTYSREDEITAIEITPEYSMTAEDQAQIQQQIDAETERILANAPTNGTDYDKALYVFERLISEVDYVEGSENNQNIISVFLNHQTICQGYAYATQYLLEKLGIPCTTVVGTVSTGAHAWNLVLLDGDYYYIDTTWGNSQYLALQDDGSMSDATSKYIDYNYFAATTESLMQSHTADERIPLPECTATQDNYYVHEGRYVSQWDEAFIGQLFGDAYSSGEPIIQVKFSNADLYEQTVQHFIEEYGIADYCPGLHTFRYMEDIEGCVLFVLFPEQ